MQILRAMAIQVPTTHSLFGWIALSPLQRWEFRCSRMMYFVARYTPGMKIYASLPMLCSQSLVERITAHISHHMVGVILWRWVTQDIVAKFFANCTQSYQWGFSFFQLFLMVVFLSIWNIGIYFMWLKAHLTMKQRGRSDTPMGYRGLLDLATSVNDSLKADKEEPVEMTNGQLRYRIQKRWDGGKIAYDSVPLQRPYSFREGFKTWVKTNKRWRAALFVSASLCSTTWMLSGTFFFFSTFSFLGVLFAVLLGQTHKSRTFMTCCGIILGIGIGIPMGHFIIDTYRDY